LETFREKLAGIPSALAHKPLYDVLLELVPSCTYTTKRVAQIWSVDSFDRFHSFIMATADYVTSRISSTDGFNVEKPLLVTSILGRFVRRCRLEYIQLDFDAAMRLWDMFTLLVDPETSCTSSYVQSTEESIGRLGVG
jgi:hypothetical protein